MATKEVVQVSPRGVGSYLTTALEELLGYLLDSVILALGASEGSLMLLHEGRELLTVNSARGPRQEVVRTARRHLGEGISGWVAKTREPLLLIGPVRDERFPGTSPKVKDALCVPLLVEDRVIGVLSLSNKKGPDTFSQEDLDRLLIIAQPVARIVSMILAQREADAESSVWARKQLAREIHDGPLQTLSSILLTLRLYEEFRQRDPSQAEEELQRARQHTEGALQELRHLVFDLRLPESTDLSLVQELQQYLSDFQGRSGIEIEYRVIGEERELPLNVKSNLYRIAQEALSNVRRHAAAQRVEVRLDFRPHELVLTIRDHGKGFELEEVDTRLQKKQFGLLGIHERTYLLGGSLSITTELGKGTTIRVLVPL